MAKCSELFVEQWSNFSPTPIQALPAPIDAEDFVALQAQWNEPTYGVEISFNDNATKGMLVVRRIKLLRLLMDILGNRSPDAPVDRELTSVEMSLSQLIFEQIAFAIGQSWPEQQSLSYKLEEPDDQPNRSRVFPPDEKLLTSGMQIQIADSTVILQIALAKNETSKLLGADMQVSKPNPNNRVSREMISEICVRITAGLGSSELDMNDLVSMSAGDIIVLNQSVAEPLTVFANDEPVFRAWPGRVDQQQAINIESSHG